MALNAHPSSDRIINRFVDRAFGREQIEGARLAFYARLGGISLLMIGVVLRTSGISLVYYVTVLALLAMSGWAFYRVTAVLRRRSRRRIAALRAGLVLADMALITLALVVPGPGTPEMWPEAMQLRIGNVGFLFAFLAFSALTYSPGLALWSGFAAAISWLAGVAWLLTRPASFTLGASDFMEMDLQQAIATLLDPNYVSVIKAAQDALLMIIAGAVIALAVSRGRAHAFSQIRQEREKATLSRYFSPDLASELMSRPASVSHDRSSRAAVLFADIFNFTDLAETHTPEETLSFLREFHRRATGQVFEHGGTLNKFIGDEVMATFGAIHPMQDPASAALRCAVGLARKVADWSDQRVAEGKSPVRVGIGVHFGDLAVGDIGDRRCLELAVIGDVVNIANRLQVKTRDLDACIVASETILTTAAAEEADPALMALFVETQDLTLKGRGEPVKAAIVRLT